MVVKETVVDVLSYESSFCLIFKYQFHSQGIILKRSAHKTLVQFV